MKFHVLLNGEEHTTFLPDLATAQEVGRQLAAASPGVEISIDGYVAGLAEGAPLIRAWTYHRETGDWIGPSV